MANKKSLIFLWAAIGALVCVRSWAGMQPADSVRAQCSALTSADFSQTLDAPTQITKAVLTDPQEDRPPYCQVEGYVTPNVGFVLALPARNWNKKFFQLGCGGFCGSTDWISSCDDALRRDYACIISDNGHKSTGADAKWAFNNLAAEVDHAYRAPHVTALAGKAIVERFYGQAPQKSYFAGASTGGRLALMEAQRFPWDFDGIIAGVPSVNVPLIYMHLLWANRSLVDRSGSPVLNEADIETLHAAVMARCDRDDGLEDGTITDPRQCSFEPSELLCRDAKKPSCLTAMQVEAARRLYSGPISSSGEPIYMPGPMKGSERTWLDYFWGGEGGNKWAMYNFAGDAFRYSAFQPAPGPKWRPEDFDFDRDYRRLTQSEALYAATNPDLRRFKAAGGKLILYAGWADAIGMPLPAIDYYETVERTMGGPAATQDFVRLFVLPGMAHGPDARGAFKVDWVSYLETWVERGQAPDKIHSTRIRFDPLKATGREQQLRAQGKPTPDPALIAYTRPVYPYPVVAKYVGHGDPNNEENFEPVLPGEACRAPRSDVWCAPALNCVEPRCPRGTTKEPQGSSGKR